MDWPTKLREAAKWFDLIDRLLAATKIEDNASGDVQRFVDAIGGPSTLIQDDLRRLAVAIERHDADREAGQCQAPIHYYAATISDTLALMDDVCERTRDDPPDLAGELDHLRGGDE